LKRNHHFFSRLLALLIFISIYLFSCAFLDEIFQPEPSILGVGNPEIVFIYEIDKSNALDYALFLDREGYRTDIIPFSKVTATDFSVYRLIIVGADTGTEYSWGTPKEVEALKSSEKQVIGLGPGGASLFQELQLSISYENSMFFSDNYIYVIDASHIIFNEPHSVSIPYDRIIKVYNSTGIRADSIGIYEANIVSYASRYGRSVVYQNYYPIVQEDRYLLWGYSSSPTYITSVGKDLFLNVVSYLTNE